MAVTEASMAAKRFKWEVRRSVSERISLLKKANTPAAIGEIVVALLSHNTPSFRQWRRVLWILFQKRYSDKNAIYTIYEMAGVKAKEERTHIRSQQKLWEFQKRESEFRDWFWDYYR